jgi:hypothetical protein
MQQNPGPNEEEKRTDGDRDRAEEQNPTVPNGNDDEQGSKGKKTAVAAFHTLSSACHSSTRAAPRCRPSYRGDGINSEEGSESDRSKETGSGSWP